MKVITGFPIYYVGGKQNKVVIPKKKKFPKRIGVKVISFNGVNDSSFDGDNMMSFDGDSLTSFDGKKAASAQIAEFQKFANSKGYTPKLTVDGKYGANTQKAIDAWGAEFDKINPVVKSGLETVTNKPAETKLVSPYQFDDRSIVPADNYAKDKDKKSVKEKISGLSKGAKIGIAIGGVAIIGLIVYAIVRKRKNKI